MTSIRKESIYQISLENASDSFLPGGRK